MLFKYNLKIVKLNNSRDLSTDNPEPEDIHLKSQSYKEYKLSCLAENSERIRANFYHIGFKVVKCKIDPSYIHLQNKIKLNLSEQLSLFSQLSLFEKTNLNLEQSLIEVLLNAIRLSVKQNFKLISVVLQLITYIYNGKQLSEAIHLSHAFSTEIVNLIQIAEKTNQTKLIYNAILQILKHKVRQKQYLKNLSIYPTILAISLLILSYILVTFILPEIQSLASLLFVNSPNTLENNSLATVSIINFLNFIQSYWYLFLLTVSGLWFVIFLLRLNENRWYFYWYKITLIINPFCLIQYYSKLQQSFLLLAIVTQEGFNLIDGLKILSNLERHPFFRHGFNKICHEIKFNGNNVWVSFQKSGLFPIEVLTLVQVAEASANLGATFQELAETYQNKVQSLGQKIRQSAMPAVSVFFGLIMLWLVIAVILPAYDLLNKVVF